MEHMNMMNFSRTPYAFETAQHRAASMALYANSKAQNQHHIDNNKSYHNQNQNNIHRLQSSYEPHLTSQTNLAHRFSIDYILSLAAGHQIPQQVQPQLDTTNNDISSPLQQRLNKEDQTAESQTTPSATSVANAAIINQTVSQNSSSKKKTRTVFTKLQVMQLETVFKGKRYLSGAERSRLANELHLSETQVKIWFQNKRNKQKRSNSAANIQASLLASAAALNHWTNQLGLANVAHNPQGSSMSQLDNQASNNWTVN